MQRTGIIYILTFMLYIQSISSLIISHEHHQEKITDIPARSEDNRMLNGKTIGNSVDYSNIAQIYYPHYPNPDDPTTITELWCRGVLIAPKWVVTVAHCFDKVIRSTKRKSFTNFVVIFKQITSKSFTGRHAWVAVGSNVTHGFSTNVHLDKLFINNRYEIRYDTPYDIRYEIRYDTYTDVDVALIELRDAVSKHIAAPPYRIYSDLEYDTSRMYPHTQNCWVVSAEHSSPDEAIVLDVKPPIRMKVFVGTEKYCLDLEKKLYQGKVALKYKEEYMCATTNESVNPGARLCTGDDGAAIVCGNGYLLGLLSQLHESGKCEGENAYGKYVYLGNSHVYKWMSGIIYGTIQSDDVFRGDGSKESASRLVEASKAVTWVLTLISLAVTLNTYY